MYLVTRTKTEAERSEEDGQMIAVNKFDGCHVEDSDSYAQNILESIKLGDHRTQGLRIFELSVDYDGVPKLGKELTPV